MQWRHWNNLFGVTTEIAFDYSEGKRRILARETIPAQRLNDVFDLNESMFNETKIKEVIRNGTQKHRVQVANIPQEIYWRWRRELGNPHIDRDAARRWKDRLNDSSHRVWRTAEGTL